MDLRKKRFGVSIWLAKYSFGSSNEKLLYSNKGFTFDQFKKWQWFFRYRTAKLQIENPRMCVNMVTYNYDFKTPFEQEHKYLKGRIKGCKQSITKIENAIKKHNETTLDMFPDDNVLLKKAENKLGLKISELKEFGNKLVELLRDQT